MYYEVYNIIETHIGVFGKPQDTSCCRGNRFGAATVVTAAGRRNIVKFEQFLGTEKIQKTVNLRRNQKRQRMVSHTYGRDDVYRVVSTQSRYGPIAAVFDRAVVL